MYEKIIKRMLQAKTKEELLTCEVDLQIQYNHLSEELLEDGAISEKDYEGILTFYRSSRELLVDINEKAENLQKKFPRAIEILQLAILYYSREILHLLYSGYWDNLLVMKGKKKSGLLIWLKNLKKPDGIIPWSVAVLFFYNHRYWGLQKEVRKPESQKVD